MLTFIAALTLSASAYAAVDINTASQAELETLSGIGPAKAQAIINYRRQHGGFESKEDVTKVDGIGPGTLKKLSDKINVRKAVKEIPPSGTIPSSIELD